MEWLNDGQHVEHYRIEIWDGRSWKSVVEGRAIGERALDVEWEALVVRTPGAHGIEVLQRKANGIHRPMT